MLVLTKSKNSISDYNLMHTYMEADILIKLEYPKFPTAHTEVSVSDFGTFLWQFPICTLYSSAGFMDPIRLLCGGLRGFCREGTCQISRCTLVFAHTRRMLGYHPVGHFQINMFRIAQ